MPGAPYISIDLDQEAPAYRQIADGLRQHLVNGALRAGDLLPPVRQLALDLGVHFNTVAQAYRILADEGWLDLKRRRGAAVLEREAPKRPDKKQLEGILKRVSELTSELRAAGMEPARIARMLRGLAEGMEK